MSWYPVASCIPIEITIVDGAPVTYYIGDVHDPNFKMNGFCVYDFSAWYIITPVGDYYMCGHSEPNSFPVVERHIADPPAKNVFYLRKAPGRPEWVQTEIDAYMGE